MQKASVLIDCPDQKGLVYKVSKIFYERNLNIENNQEFVDKEEEKFFMRSVVTGDFNSKELLNELKEAIPNANIKVLEPKKKNIILMATKEPHALGDILIKNADKELNTSISCVISNHKSLQTLVKRFDIPFFYVPSIDDRLAHEKEVSNIIEKHSFDYIVLAKYMRILTPSFVSKYEEKIINIHHSFLPAFIGANPYKQAHKRGVKIIGATAHFVTNDLDEGPIIAQDVIPITHRLSWKEMQQAGQDVEKVVLSRALNLVLENRVFIYKNKTVIF